MTDRSSESVKLVQELRDEAILRRHEEPNDVDDLDILFDRAADEIERLNVDLASSREQLADLTKRWGAVVDDRDRLRAAITDALRALNSVDTITAVQILHAAFESETFSNDLEPEGKRG